MFRRIVLSTAVAVCALAPTHARADRPRFGVGMDVGVPSGATGSLVYRPLRMLRVHAGGGHNLVAPGVQGGVTLAPLGGFITPTLQVDAGRYFAGDGNAAYARLSDTPRQAVPEQLGYDFASAHAGLELGSDRVRFHIQGGLSYVRADWTEAGTSTDGDVTTMTDLEVRAVGASARLGFIIYFPE